MERLYKYIDKVIKQDIQKSGYVYLSDDVIFVKDKISEKLNELGLDGISSLGRSRRIEKINKIIYNDYKSMSDNYMQHQKEEQIEPFIEYQQFLDENKYSKVHRTKIKGLFYKYLKESSPAIIQIRNDYFYSSEKVILRFIDSINDIINQIKPHQAYDYKNLFFRGHSNLDWKLIPSIYRGNWIENEHNMFREVLIRNPKEFMSTKSAFEKLTIMQHYGLPTRLLDITKNPLVALYFACSDSTQLDNPGEIFFFIPNDEIVKFYDSDTVSILSNIAKTDRDLIINSKLASEDFNSEANGKVLKFLHLIKEEKPYFLPKIDSKDFNKVLIVKPIHNNLRIKHQQGYFFLFGINNMIKQPASADFSYKEDGKIIKFFIEPDKKKSILKELEAVGVSSDTLFPEIDNGTEYIKNKY